MNQLDQFYTNDNISKKPRTSIVIQYRADDAMQLADSIWKDTGILVSGVRTYYDTAAGTVDYANGVIKINSVLISSVSNVDGSASTQFRLTAIPNSNDVVPVRNQLLEIDTTNTSVVGSIDATATTGKGYTVSSSGSGGDTTTTTTVTTSRSTASTSSY